MKLIQLQINGYKNLTSKTVFDFKDCTNYVALIGLNGSGKSNILEAISRIIYSYHHKEPINNFSYLLEYEKDNKTIRLENNEVFVNNKKRKKQINDFLPSQVIACYSGEETRLWEDIFQQPYLAYFNKIKLNYLSQKLHFLYINKFNWNSALLMLLCHNDGQQFIKDLLGIADLQTEIKIRFRFVDEYENRKQKFSLDNTSELTVPQFIDRIKKEQEGEPSQYLQISQISSIDLGNIQNENQNDQWCRQFFEYLFLATMPKSKKLIESIDIEFGNKNVRTLSEGEKKVILVKCIAILALQDSFVLLDEPDSHVHLERKKQIIEALSQTNHISFFTTHSPTLTKYCTKENVFKIENGVVTLANSIYEGIEHLIDEDDVLKAMFSSKDIILCEGKTDDLYINKALEHFKEDYPTLKFDFLRIGGTDHENIKHVIDKLSTESGKKIIILVDRDGAGENVYRQLFPGLTTEKKDIDYKSYKDNIVFLMIPPIDSTQTNSSFQIENYFGNDLIRDVAKDFIDKSYTNNNAFSDLTNKLQGNVKSELRSKIKNKNNMLNFKVLLEKLQEIMDG